MKTQAIDLSKRQVREIEYHRGHAQKHEILLYEPLSWEVIYRPSARWWNAYWQMYAHLTSLDLKGKRVLVLGCGFGEDALRLAKLGAHVHGCDLSPDSLSLARKRADREGLSVSFAEMPAEAMAYPSDHFDCILARDILHHVDIPRTLKEIQRVAKSGAIFVVNEIYSHSMTNFLRHSAPVAKYLYPRMRRFIYGNETPYITADERKLNETDLSLIMALGGRISLRKHFNFLVTRVFPDTSKWLCIIDRILLILLAPLAHFLAGRVLLAGPIRKAA